MSFSVLRVGCEAIKTLALLWVQQCLLWYTHSYKTVLPAAKP